MAFVLSDAVRAHIKSEERRLIDLIIEVTKVPSPSNREHMRAEYIKNWLHAHGMERAYVDPAQNVVLPVGDIETDLKVYMAHIDTVFPDMDAIPVKEDEEKIYAPGVGDDTTNVAMLMLLAEYIHKIGLKPKCGMLFVFNAGEEGLGNLKGVRQIMKDFEGKVAQLISFDGQYSRVTNHAVGSHRWRVSLKTEGGHSYGKFGNKNAIAGMSEVVCALYQVKVPNNNCKTTYNVGLIEGGTSVNTIAQDCAMLYEYRSNNKQSLDTMHSTFLGIIESFKAKGFELTLELLGDRPCMGEMDTEKLRALTERVCDIVEREYGTRPQYGSGSTDCNIPYSLGIPACAIGCYFGQGGHTREEFIFKNSLPTGTSIMYTIVLEEF